MPEMTYDDSQALRHLPEGVYDFTVTDSKHKYAKGTGNEMFEIPLTVDGREHGTAIVFDHLVFTKKTFFKISQFLASCGKGAERGSTVELEAQDLMVGYSGKCKLKDEKHNGETKSKVAQYIVPIKATRASKPVASESVDLPF